jgi:DNA replication protein DnaC
MERSEILTAMGGLKLFGMKAAYDEIVAVAVKRQHEPQRIVGELLTAELREKQARSMKYQLTVAKLPFAKEVDEFVFADTPVNETLVRELAGGGFLGQQRNLVLVGGTGSGKTQVSRALPGPAPRGRQRGSRLRPGDRGSGPVAGLPTTGPRCRPEPGQFGLRRA